MKKRGYHIGPGAPSLMLVAMVLCLSTLCLLGLSSAQGDLKLTQRSTAVSQERARLNALSERSLAALDAVLLDCAGAATEEEYLKQVAERLPENMILEDRTVLWTETGEDRELECAAEIAPLGTSPRVQWTIHRHWAGIGGME